MCLFEDTACVRGDGVRVHAEGVCLRSPLVWIAVCYGHRSYLFLRWVHFHGCRAWAPNLELLIMVTLSWVMSGHMVLLMFLVTCDAFRCTPTTSRQSLKLGGILVMSSRSSLSAGASLERAHMRLAKDWLVIISCSTLAYLTWSYLCVNCSWIARRDRGCLLSFITSIRSRNSEIVIEHHIVIVLLYITAQVEVFAQETHQLVTWSIVCYHGRLWLHFSEHGIKEFPTVATTLHSWVYKEIEHWKRFHLNHFASTTPNEQLFIANFDKSYTACTLWLEKYYVAVSLQLAKCRDCWW